jgi:hypothetical protein
VTVQRSADRRARADVRQAGGDLGRSFTHHDDPPTANFQAGQRRQQVESAPAYGSGDRHPRALAAIAGRRSADERQVAVTHLERRGRHRAERDLRDVRQEDAAGEGVLQHDGPVATFDEEAVGQRTEGQPAQHGLLPGSDSLDSHAELLLQDGRPGIAEDREGLGPGERGIPPGSDEQNVIRRGRRDRRREVEEAAATGGVDDVHALRGGETADEGNEERKASESLEHDAASGKARAASDDAPPTDEARRAEKARSLSR